MKKLLVVFTLLSGLIFATLFIGVAPALAAPFNPDEVVTGDDYTLEAGETLNGNLVVIGGTAIVEEGAVVTGQLVIFGGSATLSGTVEEDVVVFGGSLELTATAVVEGNLVRSGGSVRGEEGYEVRGSESQGFATPPLNIPTPVRPFAEDSVWWPVRGLFNFIWQSMVALTTAIAAGLLALVIVLLLPEQTRRVSAAMLTAPILSGGVGLLTLIAVPALAVVLALATLLCFSPFSLLAMLIYGIALFFGWIAVGALLGERLAASTRWQNASPAVAAAAGAFLLTLVVSGLSVLPGGEFLSSLMGLVVAAVGLGAVTLTRFGTQAYLPAPPTTPAPTMPDAGQAAS
jgi:hypothetical protein